MPRFHLSTLLLMCLFTGAVVGVALNHDVWRLEYELPASEYVDDKRFIPHLIAVDSDSMKLAVLSFSKIYLFDLQASKKLWMQEIEIPHSSIEEIRFLSEGKIIEVSAVKHMLVWRIDATNGAVIAHDKSKTLTDSSMDSQRFRKNYRFIAGAPNRAEQIEINGLASTTSHVAMAIESEYSFKFSELQVAICAAYFKDGNKVVIGGEGIGIWRRMRNYGWIGFLELPLTWVALLSFAGLNVIFFRWVRGRIQNRKMRNV